ncbi:MULTISPECIES: hypothetical protein [Nostocales]|uniref:Uncharacterized protein n=3 Tax=Nostocales TaxID=1161 RepID=A0A0C1NF10_9CYAN|nr:hypothetical protein [Tolypothrix bouteillei]KAF3887450.1 hypothetical protein DA73_0400019605 [Tolypothrix bouteillei VB521301]
MAIKLEEIPHHVLPPQFVKVVESDAATAVPKERLISFLMANDGYKCRKTTKINACDNCYMISVADNHNKGS